MVESKVLDAKDPRRWIDFELFSQFQITSDQHRVTVLPSAALTFGREAVDRQRYRNKRIALPQQRYW